jgi:aerobic carbon-monoxide dehydrogenase medium subunit
VKPAPFRYIAPTTIEHALSLLAEHGDNAKILAGGQSLVPALNFRLARYDVLIDINRISQLSFICHDNGIVRIGSMTRQREIETSDLLARHAPLLAEATRSIAHLPIRSRGTIGGSLSHADPAAEYPAVALALDAELVIAHASGQRSVPARDFIVGPLETALRPDELLTEIRIAARRADEGFAFEEVSRRRGDFAVIGVAAAMSCADGRISDSRLAIFGLGDGPALADDAARALIGRVATPELFEQAGLAAAASVTTQGDLHATADYRTHLIQTLVPRVAGRAFRHAAGASS